MLTMWDQHKLFRYEKQLNLLGFNVIFFVTWKTDAVLYYLYGPDHVRMNFRLKVNYKANFADQLNDFPQFTFSCMQ